MERRFMLICEVLIGGKKTNENFKAFENNKYRTGGGEGQYYEHIYMKTFLQCKNRCEYRLFNRILNK